MKKTRSKPLVIIQCYEDRQQTLKLKKVDHVSEEIGNNDHIKPKNEATDSPPPPPPMPVMENHQNGDHNIEQKTPKSFTTDLNKTLNLRKNGTLTRTPTPDYNNKTEPAQIKLKNNDKAELESLESYKLKNPQNVAPKPPSNYFMKAPNGTATMKKNVRPVSVTIGEYASNGDRREPTKLDFLNGVDKPDGVYGEDVSITNRLQSELALTLSRSNLRKKTDALDQAIANRIIKDYNEDSDVSLDRNFHARYGNNILPLPPSITIPKITKIKH